MTKSTAGRREINIRLIHNGLQPGKPLSAEVLEFGMQDSKGGILPGTLLPEGLQRLDAVLTLERDDNGQPVFSGKFAHGTPADRFLFLSWKRAGVHDHPWGWRIKIPLGGIDWPKVRAAEKPGKCVAANVVDRKPHSSGPVNWRVEAL
jgi:hypothetical protein